MANMNYQKASPNSGRGISSSQWNGFLDMHRDYTQNRAGGGMLPPVVANSVIASAVLQDDMDDIPPFSPCRIVRNVNNIDILSGLPSYIVEPVDAVDVNGDPTDRHGNYGFTLGRGCNSAEGGQIVISGVALVSLTREEALGLEEYNDAYGDPYPAYEGNYDTAYYAVPDGTILDDSIPVRIAPVGHFKVLSWYDPATVEQVAPDQGDLVYFAIDMSQRFTSASMDTFATIAGYQGENDAQTFNFGYCYIDSGVTGTMATIADNPRIGNNSSAGTVTPGNEPSFLSKESAFRCKVTNTQLWDVGAGRSHSIAYSRTLNRLILTGSQPHGDGRVHSWYYSVDPDELVSRGRSSGYYLGSGWGNWDDDTTDSIPYPTYLYTSADMFAEGTVMLAADYMTKGGNTSTSFKNQGVASQLADDISCAIVLMLDANHEYATYCEAKCPEEGVLISADYGEFKIIDKKPLHSNSTSGTYPQWNRCNGFLKNERSMSGIVEINTINATAHTGTKYCVDPLLTEEGLKEVITGTVKTNVIGLTRANHVDKMPQPQYQCSLSLITKQSMPSTSNITIDTTTLYKFACPTTLRVWGVDDAGVETQLDSSVWDVNPNALHDASTLNFETVYNVNFFWEEKYKFVYFDIETDATSFADITGTITAHRRTNYGGDSTYGNGQYTQDADLTLPAWPTYPNGDTESAGIYYLYTR